MKIQLFSISLLNVVASIGHSELVFYIIYSTSFPQFWLCRHTHKKRLVCLYDEVKVDLSLWLNIVNWIMNFQAQSTRKLADFVFAGVMYGQLLSYLYLIVPFIKNRFQSGYGNPLVGLLQHAFNYFMDTNIRIMT